MTAMTYTSHGASAEKATPRPAAKQRSLLHRFWDAVAEARMRQAMREIRKHSHLLPDEYERAGNKIGRRNEDQLPFIRD